LLACAHPRHTSPTSLGGYQQDLKANLTALFATLQPDVVAFQGEGLVASPVRWVGSEAGLAPYPCWSTCSYDSYGAGDPDAPTWFAAETDFTLQREDQWFYSSSAGVHSPAELRNMYETSVGHNTALIVDIAPYPNGTVPAAQAAAASALGAFVAACYNAPIVQGSGNGQRVITLMPSVALAIDRVVVQEDIRSGQLVRAFELSALLPGGATQLLASGTSIGHKFIAVLAAPVTVAQVTINFTAVAALAPSGAPFISNFAVFSCDSLAAEADAAWVASGY
jgi:alpha-L-fucosidase